MSEERRQWAEVVRIAKKYGAQSPIAMTAARKYLEECNAAGLAYDPASDRMKPARTPKP